MDHIHGANCGCVDFAFVEESQDLIEAIDIMNIKCLNELKQDSGKAVFFEIAQKYQKQNKVESDIDAELLFIIPFNARVKIMSLTILAEINYEPIIANLWTN